MSVKIHGAIRTSIMFSRKLPYVEEVVKYLIQLKLVVKITSGEYFERVIMDSHLKD